MEYIKTVYLCVCVYIYIYIYIYIYALKIKILFLLNLDKFCLYASMTFCDQSNFKFN